MRGNGRTLGRVVALGAAGMTGVAQGRLDAREAKLATAPVDPDVLEFR